MHSPGFAPLVAATTRLGEAAHQRLLAATQELALEPGEWPSVLQLLGRTLNCHCAAAVSTTPDRDTPRSLGTLGITVDDHREFLGTWHKRNVYGSRCPIRAGAIVLGQDIVPQAELVRSAMYREYLAPRAIQEILRLDVLHADDRSLSISLGRPWSSGAFTKDELQFVHIVMPHLQHAATVQARLGDASALARSALDALETAQAPVFVLDRRGRVVHASIEAERLLCESDGLIAGANGLRAATPTHSGRLAALVGRAAGSNGAPVVSGTLRLPRPSGKPDLTLVAMPLSPRASLPLAHRPAVVLQVTDPLARPTPNRALLAEAFELTPAEADLAADLLCGLGVREIAARRERSIATVRTHLASVLAKTGTSRQSELVRLLMRLPRIPVQGRPFTRA
jgi:DNA-binding CsgD family transcriptional regulator/PAS domain-containing protein